MFSPSEEILKFNSNVPQRTQRGMQKKEFKN
jgi:hypothetical protein